MKELYNIRHKIYDAVEDSIDDNVLNKVSREYKFYFWANTESYFNVFSNFNNNIDNYIKEMILLNKVNQPIINQVKLKFIKEII